MGLRDIAKPVLDPYQILANTFQPKEGEEKVHPNVVALARAYQFIGEGNLSVNGQLPDQSYALAEYLIHGGRIRFDLTALSKTEQRKFHDYLLVQQIKQYAEEGIADLVPRKFATHGRAGLDASGSPAESKSIVTGGVADLLTPVIYSKHAGIDLPIGGEGRQENGKTIEVDGSWGHLYVFKDNDFVMVGVEPSAPGKINARSGLKHSMVGTTETLSPFGALKINDPALEEAQRKQGKASLSTRSKYNWAVVKITSDIINNIEPLTLQTENERRSFIAALNKPPKNAVAVHDPKARMDQMKAWQKTTKYKHTLRYQVKIFLLSIISAAINIVSSFFTGATATPLSRQADINKSTATSAMDQQKQFEHNSMLDITHGLHLEKDMQSVAHSTLAEKIEQSTVTVAPLQLNQHIDKNETVVDIKSEGEHPHL